MLIRNAAIAKGVEIVQFMRDGPMTASDEKKHSRVRYHIVIRDTKAWVFGDISTYATIKKGVVLQLVSEEPTRLFAISGNARYSINPNHIEPYRHQKHKGMVVYHPLLGVVKRDSK